MRWLTYPITIAVLLLALPVHADSIPATAYQRSNRALVAHYLLPRYQQLSATTATLAATAQRDCTAATLRPLYQEALAAWMGVQHLRFGPAELFLRANRIFFAPDPRGRVATQINELLHTADRAALQPERFRNASVAVQGFPALEYLLWTDAADKDHDYRCALIVTITDNLHEMAAGLLADWQGGDIAFARVVANPGPDNTYYADHQEATLPLLRSLYDGLQMIADIKLKPVLADPQQAESRLSGLSLANIIANLESLQALYTTADGFSRIVQEQGGDPDLDPLLHKAFAMTLATAQSITPPLTAAVSNPATRVHVEKLHTQVRALKQLIKDRLAPALGLKVGFNAYDGD